MLYKLDVMDRVVLTMVILPGVRPPASRMFYQELHELAQTIDFSGDKGKAINIRYNEEQGRMLWDDVKIAPLEVEISDRLNAEIVKALKDMDAHEQLLPEYIPVYDKFVGEEVKHEE